MAEVQTLAPIHANVGIEYAYRRRLWRLIDEMNADIDAAITGAYRDNPPELATDALPAAQLRTIMRRLTRKWLKRFDEAAPALAAHFATETTERADGALSSILRKGGFSVRFKLDGAAKDAFEAAVGENVSLIKSIAQQNLTEVEGLVMRSVQRGRDLGSLANDLQERFAITRRRAALIARDQNNKATSVIVAARQRSLGITEGIWVHSGGGKTQRPSHLKAGRERVQFSLKDGWYDPDVGKFILPGELVNCRCTWRPVLPFRQA